jgi:oligopeptide/dipeptide ABC transporter ATP-binding protein
VIRVAGSVHPILSVENLEVTFKTPQGAARALRGVSFDVAPGEILGLVGESGSGKSVTSLAVMGLLGRTATAEGSIRFKGVEIANMRERDLVKIRGDRMCMIFQEPMNALDPVMRIEKQLAEVLKIHAPERLAGAHAEFVELLGKLRFEDPETVLDKYPFELSGGQKQRVMIAMAILTSPDLLIADEPTTALDVTTQAEILSILRELRAEYGMAVLFITHDLGVVAELCDRVAVMYHGRIVEQAEALEFFDRPAHPYSRDLLAARPASFDGRFRAIEGSVASVYEELAGCAYEPRCASRMPVCATEKPLDHLVGERHCARCHLYDEEAE